MGGVGISDANLVKWSARQAVKGKSERNAHTMMPPAISSPAETKDIWVTISICMYGPLERRMYGYDHPSEYFGARKDPDSPNEEALHNEGHDSGHDRHRKPGCMVGGHACDASVVVDVDFKVRLGDEPHLYPLPYEQSPYEKLE